MTNKQKGALCIIGSAFFFALMALFVKLAGNINSIEKSFFRNIVALFVASIPLIKNKAGFQVPKKAIPFLFARATFGTIGLLANFYAVDHLLLADASILGKMSPFFVLLFSYLILKEKIKPQQIALIILAFIGTLFVVKPSFVNSALFPSIIAIIGAAGAGMAYTMVRKLSNYGVDKALIIFYFSLFSTLVVTPYIILNFEPLTLKQLITLLCAGLSAAGGQFCVTYAYSYAPAREISVFDYSQIIFSAILGFIFFSQIPDILSIIGYVIILSAAYLNFKFQAKQA